MHALHPGGGHQLELVVEPGEARRRRLGSKKLPGMRLEGQNAGCEAQLAGLGHDPVDQRTMAAMYAVEIADGQRTPAPGGLQRAVRNHHGVVKMLNYR